MSEVDDYIAALPPDRAEAITAVREVILANLPDGYVEGMAFGVIGYAVPLETFPDTYNGQPLSYVGLASQKNYMALYLMGVYGDEGRTASFKERYRATGKKLDMDKTCVRFRTLDQLPLDVIAEEIASTPVDEYLAAYRRVKG